jgi:hypothetical protein
VAVNSIYASIIPSYKYNLVLKSFSYGTQVMGHPVLRATILAPSQIPLCKKVLFDSFAAQPPYSPDLSPPNFHPFPNLKKKTLNVAIFLINCIERHDYSS